jgi:hypothetical protein
MLGFVLQIIGGLCLVPKRDKMRYIGCAEVRSASFEKLDANDAPPIVGTSYDIKKIPRTLG